MIVSTQKFWFDIVTGNERGRIFAIADQDVPGLTLTPVQRGRLKAFLLFTISSGKIEVNADSETEVVFNALETAGVIASGRAAEILGL